MKNNQTGLLLRAAIAAMISASTLGAIPVGLAEEKPTDKGHCMGSNACKGKGGCAQAGKNSCNGQNGCKGKGHLEKTRAECQKLAKEDTNIHFEEGKQ